MTHNNARSLQNEQFVASMQELLRKNFWSLGRGLTKKQMDTVQKLRRQREVVIERIEGSDLTWDIEIDVSGSITELKALLDEEFNSKQRSAILAIYFDLQQLDTELSEVKRNPKVFDLEMIKTLRKSQVICFLTRLDFIDLTYFPVVLKLPEKVIKLNRHKRTLYAVTPIVVLVLNAIPGVSISFSIYSALGAALFGNTISSLSTLIGIGNGYLEVIQAAKKALPVSHTSIYAPRSHAYIVAKCLAKSLPLD